MLLEACRANRTGQEFVTWVQPTANRVNAVGFTHPTKMASLRPKVQRVQ
jgi:hypothetical protein